MTKKISLLVCVVSLVAIGFPMVPASGASVSPVAQERAGEPVILTGQQFPVWSAGPELSVKAPDQQPTSDCLDNHGDGIAHNCSENPDIAADTINPNTGVPVDQLIGYRWDATKGGFVEIPFQVDEKFTRYISNFASNCNEAGPFCVGFGAYSGTEAQTSFAYDRDSLYYTQGDCFAEPEEGHEQPQPDPIEGLDDNDELVFLYRDSGALAPTDAVTPSGITELRAVRIVDPSAPDTAARFVYVGLGGADKHPHFDETNGYMSYERDADANRYLRTSDNYGNAPRGKVCNADGTVAYTNEARRPRDTAWVKSPRYAFRYDGRWALRGIRVNQEGGDRPHPLDEYGDPLIDQWKARAYAQTEDSETPCCGYQNEEDAWEFSSVTLGELAGPVRVVRTSWGSNSGTNTVRTELFYPDLIIQHTWLRVHPIPPLGGIFSYWDHTSGVITKYYNPTVPDGVPVDGVDDEVIGNGNIAIRDDGIEYQDEGEPIAGIERHVGIEIDEPGSMDPDGGCVTECAVTDVTDPTLQTPGLSSLAWEQLSGEQGTMIFKTRFNENSPGNPQGAISIPYYKDNACFDDDTGVDPSRIRRSAATQCPPGEVAPEKPISQGAFGSHGIQIIFAAETDNLAVPAQVNEVSAETRMQILPGDPGNVGDRYARGAEVPLRAIVADAPTPLTSGVVLDGPSTGSVGSTATFDATLTDDLGPVADASLDFTFQGVTKNATTDADGNASASFVVDHPAGATEALVSYAGDGLLRPASSDSAPFTVLEPTTLAFDVSGDESGHVHEEVTLAAKLTGESGPIEDAPLTFDFQGETLAATTAEDGVGSVDVTLAGPARTEDLAVTYEGDGAYDAAEASTTFEISRDDGQVAFTSDSATAGRLGDSVTFKAELSDSVGPLEDGTLHFDFQGVTYDATTDADGVASVTTVVNAPVGSTHVVVRYDGDDSRDDAQATSAFEVGKIATTLAFEDTPSSAEIGDTTTLKAKLTDRTGPLAGQAVRFSFQGANYDRVTDATGVAQAAVTVNGPAGASSVNATFAGDATRDAADATMTFTATRASVDLSFTSASATSGRIGDNAQLAAKLKDLNGGIVGAKLRFEFQGKTYEATTNGDGVATVTPFVSGPAGTTAVSVTFDGDASHEAAATSAPFTVTKRSSKIAFAAKKSGRDVVVNVALTDAHKGSAIQGRRVYVYVDGRSIGSVVTNSAGKGTLTKRYTSPQGKLFRASFAGDGTYVGRSAQARFKGSGASASA